MGDSFVEGRQVDTPGTYGETDNSFFIDTEGNRPPKQLMFVSRLRKRKFDGCGI